MGILKFFLLTIIICVNTQVYAEHLLGGQMDIVSINKKSSTEYNIGFELELITDNSSLVNASHARVALLEKYNGSWVFVEEYYLEVSERIIHTAPVDADCNNIGDRTSNLFQTQIELDLQNMEYMFVYLRCCRPGSLINILDPFENGMVISLRFSSNLLENNVLSPKVLNMADFVLMSNESNKVNISISDDSSRAFFSTTKQVGGLDGGGGPATGDANSCTGVTPSARNCLPPYENVALQDGFSDANQFREGDYVNLDNNLLEVYPTLNGNYTISFNVILSLPQIYLGTYYKTYENVFTVTDCMISEVAENERATISLQSNLVDNVLEIVSQGHELEFVIYGQAGNLVKKGTTHGDIKVNELQNGLYFLQLNNAGELTSLKFIKHNQ